MSHGPSTFGSMITSSLAPAAGTISRMSSSAHGELRALMRVHSPVWPKSWRLGHLDEAAPRGHLGVGGDRVLEVAQHHVDLGNEIAKRARIFSLCGGTKWIMRSSRTGNWRRVRARPTARGVKCLAGVRMADMGWPCCAAVEHSKFGRRNNARRGLFRARGRAAVNPSGDCSTSIARAPRAPRPRTAFAFPP